jgi:hypothetical protein
MRIFKMRKFARFADDEGIDDDSLCEAVERAQRGLIDADLGGEVVKQRIARPGQGSARGFRTVILFRRSHRAVFALGFAKKNQENIDPDDLAAFRRLAREMLGYDEATIADILDAGTLTEVVCHAKDL